jgi:hypothetical protein
LCIPAVEDGNNFGVGIVLEAIKIIGEYKKDLTVKIISLNARTFSTANTVV